MLRKQSRDLEMHRQIALPMHSHFRLSMGVGFNFCLAQISVNDFNDTSRKKVILKKTQNPQIEGVSEI